MTDYKEFYSASAGRSVPAAILDNASLMGDTTVTVLDRQERCNPKIKLGGREGYAYTVEIVDEKQQKSLREVFLFCSEGSESNYDLLDLVAAGAEGENFYKTHRSQRWADEKVTQDIRDAIIKFDGVEMKPDPRNDTGDGSLKGVRRVGHAARDLKLH